MESLQSLCTLLDCEETSLLHTASSQPSYRGANNQKKISNLKDAPAQQDKSIETLDFYAVSILTILGNVLSLANGSVFNIIYVSVCLFSSSLNTHELNHPPPQYNRLNHPSTQYNRLNLHCCQAFN